MRDPVSKSEILGVDGIYFCPSTLEVRDRQTPEFEPRVLCIATSRPVRASSETLSQ